MPTARFSDRIIKRLFGSAVLLATAGCALLPASVGQIQETFAQVVVASAERTICRDLPIGTWLRLYSGSADRRDGWQKLCAHPVETPVLGPSRP